MNAEVERQMAALARQEGFYPEIARQNRWEGESLVRIFFSENGAVLAVRIEESSGIPVLDDAALKAARALKSLPAEGLELDSLLLPVRFQLRPIPKNISE
ncbi:MAG: energy transducer TonB [Zoogloeaceae bacterium]|nr:energy transducer TonB [Zoogloeaceae bacterium]